jgi:hypothetical protein
MKRYGLQKGRLRGLDEPAPGMNLLPLALLAIDDPDALQVLQDAILEYGPSVSVDVNRGLVRNVSGRVVGSTAGEVIVSVGDDRYAWEHFEPPTEDPSRFARALAAVLLFREWSTKPWPLACDEEFRLVMARSRESLEAQFGRGTRADFHRVAYAVAQRHGYGNAEILISTQRFGRVRVHISAPVPETVLAVIHGEILAEVPMHLVVEVTAHGHPRDDYRLVTDGEVTRFNG